MNSTSFPCAGSYHIGRCHSEPGCGEGAYAQLLYVDHSTMYFCATLCAVCTMWCRRALVLGHSTNTAPCQSLVWLAGHSVALDKNVRRSSDRQSLQLLLLSTQF